MQIIERIAGMDQVQLARLQANAERILQRDDERRHGEARTILAAVAQEQARRTDEERERENAAKAVIKVRVRDMALFDRVVTAFSDLPAKDWEAEVLNAVARYPRGRGDKIARAIGKRTVGYTNLAMGSLCSAREPYLGEAPSSEHRKGEKLYSALLVDFTLNREPDGKRWWSWTMKPEAEAALRHLGVIGAPAGGSVA